MENELLVRHVEPAHIEHLWPIIEDNSDNNREAFVARVMEKRLLDGHFIPVAVWNGRVAGYAWVHDYGPHIRVGHRTARLNDLFVHPDYRRKGIGRELMKSVACWCEERKVRWLQWQSSEKAVAFYERLGHKGDPCPDPGHPFFEIEFTYKNSTKS